MTTRSSRLIGERHRHGLAPATAALQKELLTAEAADRGLAEYCAK